MVGQCLVTGSPRIVQQNIDSDTNRFVNPLLPGTCSEMVLPLVTRQEIIGALDIQSTVESAFTEQDLSVFKVLASLLVISLQNAFLFQKMGEELETTKRDLQAQTRTGWGSYLEKE